MYKILGLILLIGIGETTYTLLDLEKQIEFKKQSITEYNTMTTEMKTSSLTKNTWLEANKIIMGKYAEIRSQLKLDVGKRHVD